MKLLRRVVQRYPLHAALLSLWIGAAVLRLAWLAFRYLSNGQWSELEFPDEVAYWHVATSLAHGHGLVDDLGWRATYMPLYPAFLALFTALPDSLLWCRAAQAVLAALVAPATYLLAREFARPFAAKKSGSAQPAALRLIPLLAGLAAACDPFLVFFAPLLLTEALFTVLLVALWAVLMRLSGLCSSRSVERTDFDNGQAGRCPLKFLFALAIAAGLLAWSAVMLRPAAVILLPIIAVMLVARGWHQRTAWLTAAGTLAIVVAGLVPWAARNQQVIGQWRWFTTRSGISLYDGVRHQATGASDLAHTKQSPSLAGLSEVEWDAHFRRQAWSAIRDDPVRILSLAGTKFLRTWSLQPNVETHRGGLISLVSTAWMVGVLLTAALGLWARRRPVYPWLVLLAPPIAFTLLHMVFVGSVRYRVPLMPMLHVLSAAGIAWLLASGRSIAAHKDNRGDAVLK